MKTKYELFKENYHKQTPSDYRFDQQMFASIDNTKSERSKSATRNEHKEKAKEGKLAFQQLVTQHERCINALKICL
jgi:hypothetical protein